MGGGGGGHTHFVLPPLFLILSFNLISFNFIHIIAQDRISDNAAYLSLEAITWNRDNTSQRDTMHRNMFDISNLQ